MEQTVFNIVLGLASALGAWVLKSVTDAIKEMREADHSLRNKVQTIEVLMAGNYVTKSDLNHMTNTLSIKLDKLMDKLDTKQDKPH